MDAPFARPRVVSLKQGNRCFRPLRLFGLPQSDSQPFRLDHVLDWSHRLALAAAAKGDFDDSPALRNLVATGLVETTDEGHRLTAAGQEALRASEKTPWERRLLAVMAASFALLAVAEVVS